MTAIARPFDRRPGLDAVRGAAILLVLAGHTQVPGFAMAAPVGVTLFFALSGYLISGLIIEDLERGPFRWQRFYWRRGVRLLPAVVVFVTVVAGVGLAIGQDRAAVSAVLGLTYLGNWLRAAGMPMDPVGHLWSLAVEEQFYLFWPLVLALGFRHGRRFRYLVAAVIVAVALERLLPMSADRAEFGTDTRLDALLLGALVRLTAWRPARWLPFVAAAVIGVLVLTGGGRFAFYGPAGYASAVLVAAMIDVARVPRILVWFGEISYSLYLWHLPLILAFGPPGALASIGVAAASFYLLERPLRRRWAGRFDRRSAVAPHAHVEDVLGRKRALLPDEL